MSELVQEVIVAAVALGAAGFVARRVFGALRPKAAQGACPSCQSGSTACADNAGAVPASPAVDVHPLVLMRSKPR